jgi:hypothetical protein
MSLPKPDLHVRLCSEAKGALHLLAEVEQVPDAVLAGRMLEECLLGRIHALTIAARQLRQQGFAGSEGEE